MYIKFFGKSDPMGWHSSLLCHLYGDKGNNRAREVDLELFGLASFDNFFLEVCELKHTKALDDGRFDVRLYSSVLRYWKCALRHLPWSKDMKNTFLSCLKPIKDDGIIIADFAAKFYIDVVS